MANMKKKFDTYLENSKKKKFYWDYLYPNKNMTNMLVKTVISRLALFCLITVTCFLYTKGNYLLESIALGVIITSIYQLIWYKYQDHQFKQIQELVHNKLAYEKFWKDLSEIEHEEFILFVQELLSKLSGFKDLEINLNYSTEGIDLTGTYNNEPIVIQCHLLNENEVVEATELRKLSKLMSANKYKKAFVFSNTDFAKSSEKFVSLIGEKRRLILFNNNDLYQMAIKADMIVTEEGIDYLIKKKLECKQRKIETERIFHKKQVKPYFIYGTMLLALSLISNLFYLYFMAATLLYVLGLISCWKNICCSKNDIIYSWENKVNS